MAFSVHFIMDENTAKVTLEGELDAASAPSFRREIEKAAQQQPGRLVLFLQGLEFMASAGLRVLIFAKQKMGADVEVYAVAPQPGIRETLEKTGFEKSVIIVDNYAD
ncbi:MAG: STAS domain-containing protein [Thermostichales cyanobacterium HHBFW_bins_127]